jgi:hypothetical protein
MPPEAKNEAYYDGEGSTNPMCPYKCNDNIRGGVVNNPKCMTASQLFVDNIGGYQIIWIIGISTILSLCLICYFFYSRTRNTNEDLEQDENLNKLRLAAMELDFVQRDLH